MPFICFYADKQNNSMKNSVLALFLVLSSPLKDVTKKTALFSLPTQRCLLL